MRNWLALLWIVWAGAASAIPWQQASSPHFVIYSEDKPASVRVFAEKLERYDNAMRVLHRLDDPPVSPANRLNVYVVRSTDTVRSLLTMGRSSAGDIAGFYEGHAGNSFVIVPRNADELAPMLVLLHEYAHHFMYRHYPGAVPTWLSEGFAEFHSTARFDKDGGVGLGLPAQHRAVGLGFVSEGVLPAGKLVAADNGTLGGLETEALYAEGWALVHYLTFEPARAGQLTAYLHRLNDGEPLSEAAKSFGDPGKLSRDLVHYIGQRTMAYLPIPAAKLHQAEVTVAELSPGASAIMPLKIRSRRGVDSAAAGRLAGEMRGRAARYPDDPFVQRALAEAEYDAGNLDAAEAAADRALAADPAQTGAMLYKGRVHLARAAKAKSAEPKVWSEARSWLIRANRPEPDNPEPLLLFYQSFHDAHATPTRNAVAALYKAQDLAPEDDLVRVLAAHQHLADGEGDSARGVLAPVAYNPHGGTLAAWAAGMMKTIAADGPAKALASWNATDKVAPKRGDSAPG